MVHGRFLVPAVPLACVLVAQLLATPRSHVYSWGLVIVLGTAKFSWEETLDTRR
jgi:hypothetical protein